MIDDHHIYCVSLNKMVIVLIFSIFFLLCQIQSASTNLDSLISFNQVWSGVKTASNATFFTSHAMGQSPKYLWIGCSDSRVPPNLLMGLDVGQVFVQRNVANMADPSDISTQAVIQYTVEVLGVTDIIVAGHYLCGGVAASLNKNNYEMLEFYLSRLRHLSLQHESQLATLTGDAKTNKLVELNVAQQVLNIAATPFLQTAWKNGQTVRVHGVVYNLQTGDLVNLNITKQALSDVPDSLLVVTASTEEAEQEGQSEEKSVWPVAGVGIGIVLMLILVIVGVVVASSYAKSRGQVYEEGKKGDLAVTRDQLSKENIIAQ